MTTPKTGDVSRSARIAAIVAKFPPFPAELRADLRTLLMPSAPHSAGRKAA